MNFRFCIKAILFLLLPMIVHAGKQEANIAFENGLKAFKRGEYVIAADKFMAARLLADSPDMKVTALKHASRSYRKAGLLKKEFECVESLLNAYPTKINYKELVNREYNIGNQFFEGHRDPAYMSLKWIPWLTGSDHTELIYSTALKHAPFSSYAPQARLRLARIYIDNGKSNEGIKQLRTLIKKYPDSEAKMYGYLELANALMHLARYGDGDGAYNKEANEVMEEYLQKYPESKEVSWVKKRILESKDISAERLYNLAKFYNRVGRVKPAERYLNKVLREYPDSVPVDESEEMLSNIDNKFVPLKFRPKLESRYQKFEEKELPVEDEPIMITPEASKGKWLLPIRDLGLGNKVKVNRKKTGRD